MTEQTIGNGVKIPSQVESSNITIVRKSVVATSNIEEGDVFSLKNITLKRDGDSGTSPMEIWHLLRKKPSHNYMEDAKIKW